MKTPTAICIAMAALLTLALNLHSQNVPAKPPAEQLKALRGKNIELIQKQQATLLKLDELEKQSEQIRFLTKRG